MSPRIDLELFDRPGEQKTKVYPPAEACEIEEEFHFDVNSYNSDVLRLTFMNCNDIFPAKVSKLDIRLCNLPPGQIIDQWYGLQMPEWGSAGTAKSGRRVGNHYVERGQQDLGKIHIGLQVVQKGVAAWQIAPFRVFQVTVTIIEAKDVPKMDVIGKCDPYCIVGLADSRLLYRTRTVDKTYEPRWNETVSFLMADPTRDTLHIQMKDQDMAIDSAISTLDIPLGSLANQPELDQWAGMKPVSGVTKGGQLHYKIVVTEAPPRRYEPEETGITNQPKLELLKAA
jgi:hypothetical protein